MAKMNGIKFKWIMLFSKNIVGNETKGVTKTKLREYSSEDNYQENHCM
jgi:hypothetical protein